jgi:hypothetical protein
LFVLSPCILLSSLVVSSAYRWGGGCSRCIYYGWLLPFCVEAGFGTGGSATWQPGGGLYSTIYLRLFGLLLLLLCACGLFLLFDVVLV